MEIYFIRHAIAVDRMDPRVTSDEERWLTKEGIKKMEQAAKGLSAVMPELDHIYTSPYVRARQTADLVSAEFGNVPITESDNLTPGASFQAIESIAGKHPSGARIAFVGHEPDMSDQISVFITGSGCADIQMKKGAVCRVDTYQKPAKGNGRLIWLLQPAAMRAMA